MTATTDEPVTAAMDEAASVGDVKDLLRYLAVASQQVDGEGKTKPVALGTFAAYPMPDGGLMFVASIADGPMAGTHHHRVNPGMIRAAITLTSGGGPFRALGRLMGRGKQ